MRPFDYKLNGLLLTEFLTKGELGVGLLGDIEPLEFQVTELTPWFVDLLEVRVLGSRFFKHFIGRLERGFHDLVRERAQFCAALL